MNILKAAFNLMYMDHHPKQEIFKGVTKFYSFQKCIKANWGLLRVSFLMKSQLCFKGKRCKTLLHINPHQTSSSIPFWGSSEERSWECWASYNSRIFQNKSHLAPKQGRKEQEKAMMNRCIHLWAAFSKEGYECLILIINLLPPKGENILPLFTRIDKAKFIDVMFQM